MQNAVDKKPFAYQLKEYFSKHKKFGSRDRKTISMLCYNYCRCSVLFNKQITEATVINSVFLCEEKPHALLENLEPTLNEQVHLSLEEKLAILKLDSAAIFPFIKSISPKLDSNKTALSILLQPHLYLRSRPGRQEVVAKKLQELQIEIQDRTEDCITIQNGTSLNDLTGVNRDFVIQDASSQKVFSDIGLNEIKAEVSVWDCCAASGGKSILFADRLGERIQLTVSDIRENILKNCKTRLAQARIPIQKATLLNLEKAPLQGGEKFDYIICDAPCTGSGTWARTPEQLYFFKEKQIKEYQQKQIAIAKNTLQSLAPSGKFIYITCSVFSGENEETISTLEADGQYKCTSQTYYSGASIKADTLFVAVLERI